MHTMAIEAQNIEQTPLEGYCDCGENWGFFGHTKFKTSYRCPTCGDTHDMTQCAAWPITCIECPACGDHIECALTPVKGVSFR